MESCALHHLPQETLITQLRNPNHTTKKPWWPPPRVASPLSDLSVDYYKKHQADSHPLSHALLCIDRLARRPVRALLTEA